MATPEKEDETMDIGMIKSLYNYAEPIILMYGALEIFCENLGKVMEPQNKFINAIILTRMYLCHPGAMLKNKSTFIRKAANNLRLLYNIFGLDLNDKVMFLRRFPRQIPKIVYAQRYIPLKDWLSDTDKIQVQEIRVDDSKFKEDITNCPASFLQYFKYLVYTLIATRDSAWKQSFNCEERLAPSNSSLHKEMKEFINPNDTPSKSKQENASAVVRLQFKQKPPETTDTEAAKIEGYWIGMKRRVSKKDGPGTSKVKTEEETDTQEIKKEPVAATSTEVLKTEEESSTVNMTTEDSPEGRKAGATADQWTEVACVYFDPDYFTLKFVQTEQQHKYYFMKNSIEHPDQAVLKNARTTSTETPQSSKAKPQDQKVATPGNVAASNVSEQSSASSDEGQSGASL